jgi:hypothetical protein
LSERMAVSETGVVSVIICVFEGIDLPHLYS